MSMKESWLDMIMNGQIGKQDAACSTLQGNSTLHCSQTKMCKKWSVNFALHILVTFLLAIISGVAATQDTNHPVFVIGLKGGRHALEDNPRHGASRSKRSLSQGNLGGTPGQGYYCQMGVGTPQQTFNVLIDTGSSNFALAGAHHDDVAHYFNSAKSSTFVNVGTEVYVPYTKGDWHGYLGRDVTTIVSAPNVSVMAEFALIDEASEFYINGSDWQGIMGMGYAEIARPDKSVVPFFDELIDQKNMKAIFSMQLCGQVVDIKGEISMAGTLVLGGIEDSLYKGDIMYGRLLKEWYYEIIITDISVSGQSAGLACLEYNFDKTIVDSGTTNFRLPKTVFATVTDLISKHTHLLLQDVPDGFWLGDDILCWSEGNVPWTAFPPLMVSIAHNENTTFELVISPRQYLRPVPASESETSSSSEECWKYAIVPSETGTVIGAVVMEGYYVVFDREHKRIGFAQSSCSNRNPEDFNSEVTDYKVVDFNTTTCAYYKVNADRSDLLKIAYILAGVCGACLLLLLGMMVQWQVQQCRNRNRDVTEANPHTQLIDNKTPPPTPQ